MHQKALEVYNYVFVMTGRDGLSRDLPLYLPGLAPTLSFASLTVRGLFLDVLERHVLGLDPRALRPALRSIILALLPGLEEESSEDFERTIKLVDEFKLAVRPADSEPITDQHSSGDDFFWQCFFLAAITSQTRRPGALVYLVRNLPKLGQEAPEKDGDAKTRQDAAEEELSKLVTSPEPGLLLRCFAAGLSDENALIQRGFLDLLVTHLPLSSRVLQKKAKPADLELLLRSASGVVTRRDMSLNRRLWAWLLGPDPATHEADAGLESPSSPVDHQAILSSKTSYFEEYGLHPLTQALLGMINAPAESTPAERARPYRICLSLMDRWEIGGLVVPEVFLPIVDSVRRYKTEAATKMDFAEVLRSASVFFDGVESGLIFGEILGLMAQALGPGSVPQKDRADKLSLVSFILTYFNVREEEMVTVHAPLTALSVLCMLQDARDRLSSKDVSVASVNTVVMTQASKIVADLIDMVLERTFSRASSSKAASSSQLDDFAELANMDVLKKIRTFYVTEQGNLEVSPPPLNPWIIGHLLLRKAADGCSDGLVTATTPEELAARGRILTLLLLKVPRTYQLDIRPLVSSMHRCLAKSERLPFVSLSAILSMATHLYSVERLPVSELSALVPPLVRHVWSYLSASEPKYHVESVRALWHLQTALGPHNRDIEAAISALMVKDDVGGAAFAVRPSNPGRSFAVLWSHTLQDTSLNADRRVPKTPGPKTPNGDLKVLPRLSGVDYFEIMLTRPLFLILDALLDERTQLFMTVKSWLYNLVNIDKLFSVFVTSFSSIPFLDTPSIIGEAGKPPAAITISEHDDLDLALYYLRTLSNVFRFSPDAIWPILATTGVSIDGPNFDVSRFSGAEGEVTLQEFFLQVCMRCISSSGGGSEASAKVGRVTERASQLYRCALTVLHQILLNPFAEPLSSLHLEEILIERLVKSLRGPDPYVQVLLLDVVFASLKLRDVEPVDPPTSPAKEPRNINFDSGRPSSSALDAAKKSPPPPSLLKCLQAGLAAESSRPVLDSWIGFLTECLPLYSGTIFQVLIPLVETFCTQIGATFRSLQKVFRSPGSQLLSSEADAPESTLISLLNGLEQILAKGHEELLAEEARAQLVKSPEQPQGFFGTMVPGIFASESQQTRSATANDRLTVLLAFQDAVRICCTIWSWGQGAEATAQDPVSASSFSFTSLRVRNRARRLLEHLFAAETLECLETVVEIWRKAQQQQTGSTGSLVDGAATTTTTTQSGADILHLLPALDGSRPKHTIPAIFNAIYSRTNPSALDPSRKSTLTISLQDTDLVIFLVDYARSLEDDAMDEIWTDCMTFLKDLLGNPFPHRQTLPSLLEFAAILGEKVDNTNFGEQRKMRRELGVSLI